MKLKNEFDGMDRINKHLIENYINQDPVIKF